MPRSVSRPLEGTRAGSWLASFLDTHRFPAHMINRQVSTSAALADFASARSVSDKSKHAPGRPASPAETPATSTMVATTAYVGVCALAIIAPFELLRPLVRLPWQSVSNVEAVLAIVFCAWLWS